MLKNTASLRTWLAAAALLAAGLACNLPGGNASSVPTARIPITTQSVETLESNLQAAATEVAASEQVSVVITEEQLTSMIAFELKAQENPIITDPQIYLRNDQIEAYGNLQQSGFSAPLKMIFTVSVNAQGQPEYEVVDASIGPLPLPDSVRDLIKAQLDQAMAELTSETQGMILEDITIGDGTMTITGRRAVQ
jgi:hypothetical protein